MVNTMKDKQKRKLTPEDEVVKENLNVLYTAWKKDHPRIRQDEVAEMLGWESQSIVSQHLNGHTPIRLEAVLKWAKLLGVEPKQLNPKIDDYFSGFATQSSSDTDKTDAILSTLSNLNLSLSPGQKDLFEKVIEAVVIYLDENSIKLSGKIFAKLIISIYIECLTVNEDPTKTIIEKFIYLAT